MSRIVVAERTEREVFTSADGRILGMEVLVQEWYQPFSGDPETTETRTAVDTVGPFYDMPAAGRWVDELRAQQDIERASKFEDRVRQDPELRRALGIKLEEEEASDA